MRPNLFARTPAAFWDDPHISAQMLAAHLDPSHDADSRRPETIERSVAWIMSHLGLQPGMRLLDLGCGPGLYCRRFAQAGLAVTGIDYSRRSIEYAAADARAHELPITYHYHNYLELTYEAEFDAICLIWCDFGALTDDERAQLLPRIHRALRPGGAFVFDVFTLNHLAGLTETRRWEVQPHGGFWHPGPYLELQQTFLYPEADADLVQYLILNAEWAVTAYHIWNRSFSPEGIGKLLANAGFTLKNYWSDLTGKPWENGSELMGVIAQR
ncbi:MAG: class I SAM-dependent methyltransferase [Armatimonadota bacterium]